jgi:predicted AAA+ superfamily ATPase
MLFQCLSGNEKEREGRQEDFVSSLLDGDVAGHLGSSHPHSREEYARFVAAGGYPDALNRDGRRRQAYFADYLAGVLDHDAVEMSSLAHIDKLGSLFSLISAQTSREFVNSSVARLVGIPESSLHGYMRLLSDLFLIHELPAWGRDIVRRAVSKKKVSTIDTGLAAYMNRMDEEALSNLLFGEAFGGLLESFVVSELAKQMSWSSQGFSLNHYRDQDRKEVDIVVETFDRRIIALEVKASRTVSQHDFVGINKLRDAAGDSFHCGVVLYTGTGTVPFGPDLYAAPISSIWA